MATALSDMKLRPAEMLAKPVRIDPAFEDPEAVVQLCRDCSPYQLAAKVHRMAPTGKDVPWFRVFWAAGGKLLDPRAAPILHSERFIEGAKESFGAEVIVPVALMNNINAPMAAGEPHLDLPKFRGGDKLPFDLLVAMAYSNLFHDWAIPQASTISWFYDGKGGDFDYWPDGPDGGVQSVKAPVSNVGYVSDNEYMWHRIGPIGPTRDHVAPGTLSREATLNANHDGGWTITDGGDPMHFADDEIRISILWKAYAFANQREYRRFLDKTHDLTIPTIVRILNADLAERGLQPLPDDCDFTDHETLRYVRRSYRAPKLADDVRPIVD